MSDLLTPYLFVVLSAIIIFQAIERFFFAGQVKQDRDKLLEEISRLVKAVIAKNANEYVMTTSIDKVPSEEKSKIELDLIPEESLSDEEFIQAIKKDIKK